ncbi:MAG: FRG domain-containing protein [Planctomycetes bacterium]|uniref:FRG domain-containing protein n=1 Tax=Candidatus Wunengus sp. YC65 TaxID=3367701 RepID=UPI001D3BA574|nr:FRG domain-containing protein [Planctomycetota bacterium]MBI5795048.1 FRG domain-containing protein [Planctomycetota bacterium]
MNTNKTMPYDADEIREIYRVIKIATTHSTWWFRGHTETYKNPLTPKIFRDEYIPKNVVRPETESDVIKEFKRVAPALTQNIPNQDDHCNWLFLMQHHGAPTRLLDWTENALVALYFAVENFEDGKDGELWAISPYFLNKEGYGFNEIAIQPNEILQYLATEPYLAIRPASNNQEKQEKLAEKCGLSEIPQYPLDLYPTMKFSRMVAQLSTFTIHPIPHQGKNTIPDLLTDKKYLNRYLIPQYYKLNLINDLKSLGISRRTLFPDLDGLSKTIKDALFHTPSGYNPPNPPEF